MYKSALSDSTDPASDKSNSKSANAKESQYETADEDAHVVSQKLNTVLSAWKNYSNSEHVENAGEGQHKEVLKTMASGSQKDKDLLKVLRCFTKEVSSTESYDDSHDQDLSEQSDEINKGDVCNAPERVLK